ncbi:amidohydrolase family protein [Aliiglaciecola litoralis]|uniref:Amidohydrolase family protein n=1 Tax=Aliiglaciecola litoralis TaxID=582857 RepID=A0ABN1LCX3_9ALTE
MRTLLKLATSLAGLVCLPVMAANIAIINATVHTMSDQGSVQNATVLIKDGKIQQVMSPTPALAGYQVIDAKGKVVTPGLFGAYTSLGLVEVGASAGTVDSRSEATAISHTGAALDVSYAVNPASSLMAISRVEGITSAATSMANTSQLFRGQGAIISLADNTDPILKGTAFVTTGVDNNGADDTGGSRASLWVSLEQALAEADYALGKTFTPQTDWHGITSVADAQALAGVVKGEVPLLIEAHRQADLLQIIALKKRRPTLKIVILKATEGWKVAKQLAQANIAVILNPESNLPYEFDQLAATLQNAARLHEAGVTVAIGMNTHNIRLAKQHAGNAVSHGLPWDAGLAALTINPAKIYGVSESIGSIETGKRADVVIWSGDPLEVTHNAEMVLINGEITDMSSRQSKLRDRYLKVATDKTVHYQRP